MTSIAITGATGFIGRHLLTFLVNKCDQRIKILSPYFPSDMTLSSKIEVFRGHLLEPKSLDGFLEPEDILINLAFSTQNIGGNIQIISNLACKSIEARVNKFVHLSTAIVAGNAPEKVVNENTLCRPQTHYERIKFSIENLLMKKLEGHVSLLILRPTAVFGIGGHNLQKLMDDLISGNRLLNYIKSCMINNKRKHLVSVQNVIKAVWFLATANHLSSQKYIISDDDYPENNYRDVEKHVMKILYIKDYKLPRLPMPEALTAIGLLLTNSSDTIPGRIYSCQRLFDSGFSKEISFLDALTIFCEWYKSNYITNK